MENRNYILDRLKSRTLSIDEFNYDKLEAPPISSMFTPFDIMELNRIAKSIKYSAKPQLKYQEIDKIMRSRGFVKFAAGTNRVVYRPIENNTFVVKVAADAVGLGDNPAEFRNQFIFKPFVTKVFEVTPCGTLGVFERVNPITSREEFLSVASDIYEVINNWFVGEYVLADIGTRYFMNWSVRNGFGPVLLDFTYAYKLDGDKLFCSAPSINTPSGKCEGVIDYDAGFNFLYCTKCGVKYKAQELAKAVETNNVIVKAEGENKMKISIKGGTKNLEKREIITGEYADLFKATPSKPMVEVKTKGGSDKKSSKNEKVNKETTKKETKKASTKEDKKKEVICPVEFDESLKKDTSAKVESKKEKNPLDEMSVIDAFNYHMSAAKELLTKMNKDEIREALTNIDFVDIIEKYCDFVIIPTEDPAYYNDEYKSLTIKCNYKIVLHEDDEDDEEIIIYEQENGDPIEIHLSIDYVYDHLEEIGCVFSNTFGVNEFDSVEECTAKVVNIKDIFPEKASKKILVLVDASRNYVTVGNKLIAIDIIDDQSVDKVSIVSKDWLDNIMNDTETPDPVKEESDESISEETEIKSEIPVGVLAPNVAVNGVPTEEVNDSEEE